MCSCMWLSMLLSNQQQQTSAVESTLKWIHIDPLQYKLTEQLWWSVLSPFLPTTPLSTTGIPSCHHPHVCTYIVSAVKVLYRPLQIINSHSHDFVRMHRLMATDYIILVCWFDIDWVSHPCTYGPFRPSPSCSHTSVPTMHTHFSQSYFFLLSSFSLPHSPVF